MIAISLDNLYILNKRRFAAYKLRDDNNAFVDAAMMKVRCGWREGMPAGQV